MKISGILKDQGLHVFDSEHKTHAGHAVPRVWILVADQEKARIWRKTGAEFQEILTAHFNSHFHAHHHRNHESHGEDSSVAALSEWLEAARNEDVFDRIIIVASKRMLGALRDHLPTDVLACVAAEIPKDFTHHGKKELGEALHKIIVI